MSIVNQNHAATLRKNEDTKSDLLVDVDWRQVLSNSSLLSHQKIHAQKSWARFTETLKGLCPESEWFFLRDENYNDSEADILKSLEQVMKGMTSSELWPFPEKIFITAEGRDVFRTWKITVLKTEGMLPFITPSNNLTMTTWSDEYTHGYKVRAIQSFNSHKSGEA